MRILLLVLMVGPMVAVLFRPASHKWRLQKLVKIETDMDNHVKTATKEGAVFLHNLASRFLQLASSRPPGGSKEDYINNPLPALVMTRRLVEDWTTLAGMVRGVVGFSLTNLGLGAVRWPTSTDLKSAALTVLRAQWTYNQDINSLASGLVTNKHFSFNVSAADCFYMANLCSNYNYRDEALEWLKQAFHKVNLGDSSLSTRMLMHYFVQLKCVTGDSESARLALVELFRRNIGIKVTFEESLLYGYMDIAVSSCSDLSARYEKIMEQAWYEGLHREDLQEHRRLCSSKEVLSPSNNLRCRYVHYQQPHLRFQPFKLEEIQLEPPVLRFYDVITDNEAEKLKDFALTRIETAGTVKPDGTLQESIYRTSHTAWIWPDLLELNDRLTQRIADLTQMNVYTGEPNQMSRYSISGEYLPHNDFLVYNQVPWLYDRIATLMFYLNDVEEGGNTIFLNWNLTLAPIKNSAVLWFNFFPNGDADEASRHSGCPVLQGTKWVMNKWFHNEGNEFMKPCGLHRDDSFLHYYRQ